MRESLTISDEYRNITMQDIDMITMQIDATCRAMKITPKNCKSYIKKGSLKTKEAWRLYLLNSENARLDIHPASPDGTWLGDNKREAYISLKKIMGGLILAQSKLVRRFYYGY